MVRVEGIELSSSAWKADIIAIIRHPRRFLTLLILARAELKVQPLLGVMSPLIAY